MSDTGLNEQQKEAINIIEGAALVLAGAGSGKTKVVTSRIVRLIESGIAPSNILGVTFTNKAAEEMRERVVKMTKHHVLICTFHSLGARILRESIHHLGYDNNFIIYDEEDVEKLLRVCLNELGIKDKKLEVKAFRPLISQAKNAMQDPDEAVIKADRLVEDAFHKVYPLYQLKLKEYQAVDFDDLLFLTVKILSNFSLVLERYQNRWPFVLIDEYQDTNAAQYTIAKQLVKNRGNLFVVGDPDQSIYSWRGADLHNILNFEKDYPGARIIRLEQNYRSTTNILEVANALISYNLSRYEKNLWSNLGEGDKIKLFTGENDKAEAEYVASQIFYHNREGIPLKEMAVLYRTNAQSRSFEDYLIYKSIPYVIVGGISFYQRREIKDILAYLRIAFSGADFVSFVRTINLPKRGIGDTTIDKIHQGATLEWMTLIGYCEALVHDKPLKNSLRLTATQKAGLTAYMDIIYELHALSKQSSIQEMVKAVVELTGYLKYLAEDKESYDERRANLDELITKAIEWEMSAPNPSLKAFLEELSLKSSLDEADSTQDRISLMTLHNAKGLEFKVVFLVGLEEDLFPHINSKDSPAALEEERRLCYVGMTRAKEVLYLSHCFTRYLWGNLRFQDPSRFLREIPMDFVEKVVLKASKFVPELMGKVNKPLHRPATRLAPQQTEEFVQGDTIFHQDFGIGQIKEAYQGSMGLTYKVLFSNDNSLKTLVAKYAVLTRI